MNTASNIAKLLEPGIRKIYGDTYNAYPIEYPKVFEVDTSDRAWEEDQGLTGVGLVPVKPEGSSVVYDVFYQGFTKRYTHVTYGLGFIISMEAWEDALYRQIRNMPRALARSVAITQEVLAASHLNNAFNTSYVGADNKPLCASDHPLVGGGTFSNVLSTPADLDIVSFEQALIAIADFVDDRGLKIAARPIRLIVPPALDFMAQYILKSDRLPDTANNNYNPAKGKLDYVVMHWLTDPDAWFIQTDVPAGLTWLWRRKPTLTNDTHFDSENIKFKSIFRASSGWTDPRCIFGSPGA